MRKLNIRLLVCLFGFGVVLAGGAYGIHSLQTGRIGTALLHQADKAEEQGQFENVVKFLGRYLELFPEDNGQRAQLGRVLASEQVAKTMRRRERALFVLDQVLLRDPERHDMRRLIVPVAMDLQRYEVARDHLDILLKAAPDDGAVELMRGKWHEARKQYAEAAAWYRKAVAHAPGQIEGYTLLAEVLRKHLVGGENAEEIAREADSVIDAMVTSNKSSSSAHLARWRHRRSKETAAKDKDQIREEGKDVRRALELATQDAEALLTVAELEETLGDSDQAKEHLKKGLKLHPRNVRMYRALAGLEMQAGRRPEATQCLREGVRALEGVERQEMLWMAANLLLDNNEVKEARELLEQLRKAKGPRAFVDFLQARLLVGDGQWSEAAQMFERTRPLLEGAADVQKQTDLLLGQCYEQLGEPAQQLTTLERVLAREPDNIAARLGTGGAYWALGRIDQAVEQYRKVMRQPGAPIFGWLQIARMRILQNVQADGKGDWREVDDVLNQAEKAQPDSVDVPVLRAEALEARGQADKAREVLEQARQRSSDKIPLWTALAALAERQGQPEDAARLLEDAEKKGGDTAALRLARAHYWGTRPGNEARDALQKLSAGLDRFSAEEQPHLLRVLAEENYRAGNAKEAAKLWSRLADQPRHANDLRMRLLLLEMAVQADDDTSIRKVLDDFRRIEQGQGTFWHYGEALRLIRLARKGQPALLEEARARLDEVAAKRPAWPAVQLARAEIEAAKGNSEAAIANLRRAIDLGEHNPKVVRQLVQFLYQAQRYAEADQEVRKLHKDALVSANLQRIAVDVSLRNQDPSRAVKMALETVSADSKDYHDHLWLGQVMANGTRRSAEAEKHLRRAVELAEAEPETWVALVQFLAAAGEVKEAESVIEQAHKKLPADKQPAMLAPCYEALQQPDKAEKQYEALLSAKPGEMSVLRSVIGYYVRVGRAKEAETHLRRMLDRKQVEPSEADASWARWQLALVLTMANDYRRFPEALSLLGMSLDNAGQVVESEKRSTETPAEEQRIRARVLALADTRPLRAKAISLLENLAKRQTLTPLDQFLLAQMYEADGSWRRAHEHLRNLQASQGKNPVFLAHFAKSLLRQRQVDEAQRLIDRLEALEKSQQATPGSYGSIELKAKMFELRGEGDQAAALLKPLAEQQGATPDRMIQLVGLLARQKKIDEALDLCGKLWQNSTPDVAGGMSVSVLRAVPPTVAQMDRVDGWLREALKKDPQSLATTLYLADLEELRGRYEQAEALYRKVIEKDANNSIAMNNLAWLLSLHPGRGNEALPLISRAIEITGPKAELLDTRASIHLAMNRNELAVADFEAATRETSSATRYFRLARAYHASRNPKEATSALQKAKAAGLDEKMLHPLERPIYETLLAELDRK